MRRFAPCLRQSSAKPTAEERGFLAGRSPSWNPTAARLSCRPQIRGDGDFLAVGFEGDGSLLVGSEGLDALLFEPCDGFFVRVAEAVVSAAGDYGDRGIDPLQKRFARGPARAVVADFQNVGGEIDAGL